MTQVKPITPKQRRFADEYLLDLNGAAAARRAGYSAKSADKIAWRLLRTPQVRGYLDRKMEVEAERHDINADAIVRMLVTACQDAADEKQNGPRVRGIELLGKMVGLFANRLDLNFRDQSDRALIERLRLIGPQLGEIAARKLSAHESFD